MAEMRKPLLLIAMIIGVLVLWGVVVTAAAGHGRSQRVPIYLNRAYSPAERAADLVARMTVAEKASQMVTPSPAIHRLGVHPYGWWNEALHGVSRLQLNPSSGTTVVNNTTSYPTELALGSSWDPSLMYREASAISDEAREVAPENSLNLDFYAPTVNLARDPRWGRSDETFSEDPLLTGAMAAQFVDGLEGKDRNGHLLADGGGYLKAIATLKHYAANNSEVNRLTGSSDADERTVREYYTAPFRIITQHAHPGAFMSSNNSVNGTPAAASPRLIETLARQTFGFDGYFSSDCDAVDGIVKYHHWRPAGWTRPLNDAEAHAFANAAGEDLNCTVPSGDELTNANLLPAAVGAGIRTPTDLYNVNDADTSVVRLFTARMKLGEFDHVANEPWVKAARARVPSRSWTNSTASASTETPARIALAQQVADRTLVMLKDIPTMRRDGTVGPLLPIHVPRTGPFRVAVIGSLANPPSLYLGSYSSMQIGPGAANSVSPYQGIKRAIQAINPSAQVDFYSGFTGGSSVAASLTNIDPATVDAASTYDYVIVYAATDASVAREDFDRRTLALPGAQAQLIGAVAARNPNTVAVLETVGQVEVGPFEPSVAAMLWSSYNGQRKGQALADVLLGRYDPSGHLPFTWYQSASELPSITSYSIRPSASSPGRTYMYLRGPVSYPFGYGLSYTSFRESNLRLDSTRLDANDKLRVSVDVTNKGSVPGTALVQLYVKSPVEAPSLQRPLKRLEGFRQVWLATGQTKSVTLTVNVPDLAFYNSRSRRFMLDDGVYWVLIADSAADGGVRLQRSVTVRGRLAPVPSAVTAKPVMVGDPARGIQSRVMFPEGTIVLPQLTISLSDQSLYRYVGAGSRQQLPSGLRVQFASDSPHVAEVGRDGTIRTLQDGVATITAHVAYGGVSRSTQFVIRVLSQLRQLSVAGRPVRAFRPDVYSYDLIVPDRTAVPMVSASVSDRSARIRIIQARGVPGVATVKVVGPDGIPAIYSVYFARAARSDRFSTRRIGPQWRWVRLDRAAEQVGSGSLVITPEMGDLLGSTNTARNVLVQPALGDWTVESKLTFSSPPAVPVQQAGIIACQDDDNFVKFDWEYSGGTARLSETSEDSLSGSPVTHALASIPTTGLLSTSVWLRMVKHGPGYTTYYSRDGAHFMRVYEAGASLSNVKVGLFAFNGPAPGSDLRVAFSSFRVRNSGQTVPRASGRGPNRKHPAPKHSPATATAKLGCTRRDAGHSGIVCSWGRAP